MDNSNADEPNIIWFKKEREKKHGTAKWAFYFTTDELLVDPFSMKPSRDDDKKCHFFFRYADVLINPRLLHYKGWTRWADESNGHNILIVYIQEVFTVQYLATLSDPNDTATRLRVQEWTRQYGVRIYNLCVTQFDRNDTAYNDVAFCKEVLSPGLPSLNVHQVTFRVRTS